MLDVRCVDIISLLLKQLKEGILRAKIYKVSKVLATQYSNVIIYKS